MTHSALNSILFTVWVMFDIMLFKIVFCPYFFQELKGRFIVKGKRLGKLEDTFSDEANVADDGSVTEEEDDEGDEEQGKSKVSWFL